MSALYSAYATDATKEIEGVKMPVAPGVDLTIRRFNSKAARDVNTREEEKFVAYTRSGQEIPSDDREDILFTVLVEAIVADWSGVADPETGDEMPCTIENKRKVFTDLPDLKMSVVAFAMDRTNFKASLDKEAEKN